MIDWLIIIEQWTSWYIIKFSNQQIKLNICFSEK